MSGFFCLNPAILLIEIFVTKPIVVTYKNPCIGKYFECTIQLISIL